KSALTASARVGPRPSADDRTVSVDGASAAACLRTSRQPVQYAQPRAKTFVAFVPIDAPVLGRTIGSETPGGADADLPDHSLGMGCGVGTRDPSARIDAEYAPV